jgi:hypothetical protein
MAVNAAGLTNVECLRLKMIVADICLKIDVAENSLAFEAHP